MYIILSPWNKVLTHFPPNKHNTHKLRTMFGVDTFRFLLKYMEIQTEPLALPVWNKDMMSFLINHPFYFSISAQTKPKALVTYISSHAYPAPRSAPTASNTTSPFHRLIDHQFSP